MLSFLLGLVLGGCKARDFGDSAASQNLQAAQPAVFAPVSPDLGPDGLRDGVWLTFVGSNAFDSPAMIAKVLTQIREAGFDTVYPVIWNKGTTTFPSETLRRFSGVAISPQFAGRDILQEIVDANRQLGLRLAIIPWFEYGLKVAFGRARNPRAPRLDDLTETYPLAFEARKQGLLLKRRDGSDAWFDAAS